MQGAGFRVQVPSVVHPPLLLPPTRLQGGGGGKECAREGVGEGRRDGTVTRLPQVHAVLQAMSAGLTEGSGGAHLSILLLVRPG